MKKTKITAVIVAMCILLTSIAGTITASAEVNNHQNKLSPQLIEEINESAEEKVCVYISLLPCTSEAEIEKAVSEKYTWSDNDEYLKYYRQELSSVVGAYVQKFVDDHGDLLNRILVQPNSAEFVIAEVSKGNVEELAKLDIVHDIDLWSDTIEVISEDESDDSYLSKISEELSVKMNALDSVPVYISLQPCTSESEIEKIVKEKYTWTTEDEHLKYYRQELSSVVGAYVQQFVDKNYELLGDIILQPTCAEFVIAKTTKDCIIELAKLDIVHDMDYWDDTIEVTSEDDPDELYRNAFVEWSVSKYGKNCLADGYSYKELYRHVADNQTDWVLVNAKYLLPTPEVETWVRIGGRKIFSGSLCAPFKCCYGIYDVKENCFYDLDELSDNYSKYAGLIETLEALEIGKPTGDANLDNTVSISDVTCIQRMLAEYDQFTKYQNGLSDVNKDSKVNIADATDIQRYLAQLINDFD